MRAWSVKTPYYGMSLFALCAAFGFLRWGRENGAALRAALRTRAAGILAAGALCGAVFLSVPPRLRVLPDETVLMAVSRSMTFDKTVEVVTDAQRYFETLYPESIVFELQPRPHLFPYLLSILHTAIGYRVANAFVLNFLVLWGLLALVYVWTKEALEDAGNAEAFTEAGALSAMLLVVSQPVLTLSASSGGFDLLAAFCVLLSFRFLRAFLKAPSAARFEALWIALLAVSCVRYEGAVYLAVALAGLLAFRCVRAEHFAGSPVFALTPVFFLPFLWQRLLVADEFHKAAGRTVCSPSILLANTAAFLRTGLRFDFQLPYASIVNLLGFAAGLYFLATEAGAWRRPREDDGGAPARRFALIAAASLLAHWTVLASFYFSLPDSPSASRYFVVFAIVLSWLTLLFAARWDFFRKRPARLLLAAVAAVLLYHPVAMEDRVGRSLALPREHEAALDFLKDKRDFLVIADMSSLYTVYGYGAVGFRVVQANGADFLARHSTSLFADIFVIQEIDLKTGAPIPWQVLPTGFTLETVRELRTRPLSSMRISRVRRS